MRMRISHAALIWFIAVGLKYLRILVYTQSARDLRPLICLTAWKKSILCAIIRQYSKTITQTTWSSWNYPAGTQPWNNGNLSFVLIQYAYISNDECIKPLGGSVQRYLAPFLRHFDTLLTSVFVSTTLAGTQRWNNGNLTFVPTQRAYVGNGEKSDLSCNKTLGKARDAIWRRSDVILILCWPQSSFPRRYTV